MATEVQPSIMYFLQTIYLAFVSSFKPEYCNDASAIVVQKAHNNEDMHACSRALKARGASVVRTALRAGAKPAKVNEGSSFSGRRRLLCASLLALAAEHLLRQWRGRSSLAQTWTETSRPPKLALG